jgi:hypothetical protein
VDEYIIIPMNYLIFLRFSSETKIIPLSYLFDEPVGEPSSKNVYHIFNTTDTIWYDLESLALLVYSSYILTDPACVILAFCTVVRV